MSLVNDLHNLATLMSIRGVDVIGENQRTIAFTAVASGGTGLLNITAAGHLLKKGQSFNIVGGTYAGVYLVKKVISTSVIQVAGTFSVTATGNLVLYGALNGEGFIVNKADTLVIAEFVPDDPNLDPLEIIAKAYTTAEIVPISFKKIRITGGILTVVRKTPQTDLAYSNR